MGPGTIGLVGAWEAILVFYLDMKSVQAKNGHSDSDCAVYEATGGWHGIAGWRSSVDTYLINLS